MPRSETGVILVKIRLQRMGAKRRPSYRVVAIESRRRRDGRPLEYLGTYDPVAATKTLRIEIPRVEAWLARGAQLSPTAAALLRRARREAVATAEPAATTESAATAEPAATTEPAAMAEPASPVEETS